MRRARRQALPPAAGRVSDRLHAAASRGRRSPRGAGRAWPVVAVEPGRQRPQVAADGVEHALAAGAQRAISQVARADEPRGRPPPAPSISLLNIDRGVVLGPDHGVRPAVGHGLEDRLVAAGVERVALHAELQALEGGGGVQPLGDDAGRSRDRGDSRWWPPGRSRSTGRPCSSRARPSRRSAGAGPAGRSASSGRGPAAR